MLSLLCLKECGVLFLIETFKLAVWELSVCFVLLPRARVS